MDSVTQFTLGACVGVAVLGRKIGPRKAALTGGVLGTLPDLDVFMAPDDPIDAFVQHRGWTHSLFVHSALTPIFGEGIRRLFKVLREQPVHTYAAVFLCLTTHALLDAMTVYGTRLFWPFLSDPVGVGSVFIIDPIYTVPLLILMVWAFLVGDMTARLKKALVLCLGFSTLYLGWTVIAQYWVTHRANILLAETKIVPEKMLAIPAPFNSFVWRVIGIDGDRYFNLYMPVFGGAGSATIYSHPRNLRFLTCSNISEPIKKVANFSQGYYRIILDGEQISVSDLRMGLTPNYAFKFILGHFKKGELIVKPPIRREGRGDVGKDLNWLMSKLKNQPVIRPAEANAKTDLITYAKTESKTPQRTICTF